MGRTRVRRIGQWTLTVALATMTLAVLPAPTASAGSGSLDPSYGTDGVAVHRWAEPFTRGFAAAAQTDGKVVVVGDHGVPAVDGTEWAVVRLTADGQPDEEFGTHGFVGTTFTAFGGGTNRAEAVTVDAEGHLLVTGTGRREGTLHGFLVRYLTTGDRDPDFGVDGVVDLGERFFPTSIAARPGLGVAVAGGLLPTAESPAFVSRVAAFTSSGQADDSFDKDGIADLDLSLDKTRDSEPRALLGRSDGSLVLAGNAGTEDGHDGFLLAYVAADGALERSVVHAVGNGGQAVARALAEGPNGTVVAAGYARDQETNLDQFALARYDREAALDPGFGTGGIRLDQVGADRLSRAYGVAVGGDGQVLAGGGAPGEVLLARYLANGDRDETFGESGVARSAVTGADIRAMTLPPDGDTAVLAGSVGDQIGAARHVTVLGPAEPALPVASVEDVTITEGTDGVSTASVTVSLSAPAPAPVQVAWATSDGSAVAPGDYTAASGAVKIAAGERSSTAEVAIVPDSTDEGDESFTVTLSSPSGATIGDGTASVTILDDDEPAPPAAVSIQDAPAVAEGGTLSFPVVLDHAASSPITVDVETSDGTAVAPTDYAGATRTLTFAPGDTSTTFEVTTNVDSLAEPAETVLATITGTTAPAGVASSTATGTIQSSQGPPAASVGTPEAVEEGATLQFPVTLSRAPTVTATVRLSTKDGTATAGSDYVARSFQDVSIPAGQTTGYFEVSTIDDPLVENDETVIVEIRGGSNVSLGSPSSATGTIHSSDVPPPAASVGTPVAVEEGATLRFPVTLSRAPTVTATVRLSTKDGTATAGSDYVARSFQDVSIPAGQTTGYFEVSTASDTLVEGDETVIVEIRGGSNVSLGSPSSATGTVRDPVTAPTAQHALTGELVGTVRYRVPGNPAWVELTHPTPLPMGTLLDTTDGSITIKYAATQPRVALLRSSSSRTRQIRAVTLHGALLELARRRGVPSIVLADAASTCHGTASTHRATVAAAGSTSIVAKHARVTLRRGKVVVVDRCRATRVVAKTGVSVARARHGTTSPRVLRAGQAAVFRRR